MSSQDRLKVAAKGEVLLPGMDLRSGTAASQYAN
jgi:hypothetical protein